MHGHPHRRQPGRRPTGIGRGHHASGGICDARVGGPPEHDRLPHHTGSAPDSRRPDGPGCRTAHTDRPGARQEDQRRPSTRRQRPQRQRSTHGRRRTRRARRSGHGTRPRRRPGRRAPTAAARKPQPRQQGQRCKGGRPPHWTPPPPQHRRRQRAHGPRWPRQLAQGNNRPGRRGGNPSRRSGVAHQRGDRGTRRTGSHRVR